MKTIVYHKIDCFEKKSLLWNNNAVWKSNAIIRALLSFMGKKGLHEITFNSPPPPLTKKKKKEKEDTFIRWAFFLKNICFLKQK